MRYLIYCVCMFLTMTFQPLYADTPLTQPQSYRVCDLYVKVCAYSEVNADTTFYAVEGNFALTEIYQISGWQRNLSLSPGGEYVVIVYSGGNLVPHNVTKDQIMLTIYKQGKVYKTYKLGQLFNSMDSLRETVSHYHWGGVTYLGENGIQLETTEGSVYIDFVSGKVHLPFAN